jgi:hypothetical protein
MQICELEGERAQVEHGQGSHAWISRYLLKILVFKILKVVEIDV